MTGRAAQQVTIEQVLSDLGSLRQDVERGFRLQRLRDVQTVTHFVIKGAGIPGATAPEGTLYWDITNDNLYVNDAGINTWTLVGGGAPGAHAILSATHTDSVPQAVTSGSLIYGDATPDWNELVHPGAANRVLQSTAAVVGWSANAVTFPAAGAVPVGTGVANHAAYWSNVNTLTNEAQLALSRGGTAADLSATGGASQYVQQAGAGAAFTVGAILAGDLPNLGGLPALTYGVANAAGVAATYVRTDATLAVFDAVVPGTIQCDDAAGAGVAGVTARRDHQHAIVCAVPVDIANANAEGVATSFSRSDHVHNHPAALGVDLHHTEVHIVNSTGPHAEAGLTIGHVLRASAAAAFSFAAIQAGDVPGLGGVPALTLGLVNAAGAAATYVQTDASVAVFDAVVPGTIQCDDAAAAGVAAFAARRDHQHAIVCDVPNRLVPDNAQAEGTEYTFARSDHDHQITCAAPTVNLSVSSTNSEGVAANDFARSDHSHAITSSSNPGAAASLLATDANGYLQLLGLGIGVAAGAANRITMVDGGTIGQAAGPLMTFDDTLNYLEITGCNVGIGTATPATLLEVEGSTYVFVDTTSYITFLGSSDNIYGASIILRDEGEAADLKNWYVRSLNSDFQIGRASDVFAFSAANFNIEPGGNVGIGTTTPGEKLHVVGTGADGANIRIQGDYGGGVGYVAGLEFNLGAATVDAIKVYERTANNYALDFLTYGGGSLTTQVTILGNGNVGIGDLTPTEGRLSIINSVANNGAIAYLYRNQATVNQAGLVLHLDNVGDDEAAMTIRHDGTGDLLQFFDGATQVGEFTNTGHLVLDSTTGTTGYTLYVHRNLAAASTDSAVMFVYNQDSTDNQPALSVSSWADSATLIVGSLSPSEAGYFYRDYDAADDPVVTILQDHLTGAQPTLKLIQDDISEEVIEFACSDRGVINQGVSSLKSVRVSHGGTIYRLALYVDA